MTFSTHPITIRKAVREDHRKLANFLLEETYTHRHLDWRSPLEWLGNEPFFIAESNGHLHGMLACPPDPAHVYWVRLFSASSFFSIQQIWAPLFNAVVEEVSKDPENTIAAIVINDWFEDLLRDSGFTRAQDIVVLEWAGDLPTAQPIPEDVIVRPMVEEDLPIVHQVDGAAFAPLWHNSLDALELAYQQGAYCSVAETEAGVIGYQISTAAAMSGHLARLAVFPWSQRAHIGYELVRDMLVHFHRQSIWRVTVNTQSDNLASLALYARSNFHRTGEEFPVHIFHANS